MLITDYFECPICGSKLYFCSEGDAKYCTGALCIGGYASHTHTQNLLNDNQERYKEYIEYRERILREYAIGVLDVPERDFHEIWVMEEKNEL